MSFTQETFLGASIRHFNCSVGWNTQSSVFNVGLVEDDKNGDNFNPPAVGTPCHFQYQDWVFGGILQNYSKKYGQDGNPLYEVQLQDPREVLAGVQLILQDYSGVTYGVPNLYNIYGYLENTGFGNSYVNETGMPWTLVRDTFYVLQLASPIQFRGNTYLFTQFFGQSLLPYYYRVGGDSISALDFVEDTCNALACDYHISMGYLNLPGYNIDRVITVNLVSRNRVPRVGAIDDFVTNVDGAVSKNQGYELVNEVTSKFVVGGKYCSILFQGAEFADDNNYYNDPIAPYWGYDYQDNLIIGEGDFEAENGAEYKFRIDGRPIYTQTSLKALVDYQTDLAEMRAARAGQTAWESFLWFHNDNDDSIHKGKAELMGLTQGFNSNFIDFLDDAKGAGSFDGIVRAIDTVGLENLKIKNANVNKENQKRKIAKIYNYIRKFATEYYGKKFMVQIPFVYAKLVNNNIVFSWEPSDSGYVAEEYWANAAALGYLPYNPDKFTTQDNRLYSYAKFNVRSGKRGLVSSYSLDKLSPESYILDQYTGRRRGYFYENLFVKGTLDPVIVFLNSSTLYSPRVVLTLDGPVAKNNEDSYELHSTGLLKEIKFYCEDDIGETEIDNFIKDLASKFGGDYNWHGKDAVLLMPDMGAVALKSNIYRYGPWYISRTAGKVEFENDSTLVPWNHGGYSTMNLVGWSKVEDALSGQQVMEQGSVEFPGVPNVSLGSALLSNGPIITDINVNISEQGATTTYRMNTWSYQFGTLGKHNVDRISKMSKLLQEQRKAFRKLYGYAPPIENFVSVDGTIKEVDDKTQTAIVADIETDGDTRKSSVATTTTKRLTETLDDDTYEKKAGCSFDAVFAPFATSSASNFPNFESPSAGAEEPTINDLNPYGDAGISMAFPNQTSVPSQFSSKYNGTTNVRSIALKGPVIICGWGYDTDGNFVPDGIDDFRNRVDQWKVGPLDVRWDDERKVWAAAGGGGGSTIKPGVLLNGVTPGGSTNVQLQTISASGIDEGYINEPGLTNIVTAYDYLLREGMQLYAGDKVFVSKVNLTSVEILGSGGCRCEESGYLPSTSQNYWMIINVWSPC